MSGPELVLDASAILAFLKDEPGAAHVRRAIIAGAVVSAVNCAEVLSKLSDDGHDPESAADVFASGTLGKVRPFDEGAALAVARLRALTRGAGLSIGDRACLALGLATGKPVVTADRSWAKLGHLGVKVEVIR